MKYPPIYNMNYGFYNKKSLLLKKKEKI